MKVLELCRNRWFDKRGIEHRRAPCRLWHVIGTPCACHFSSRFWYVHNVLFGRREFQVFIDKRSNTTFADLQNILQNNSLTVGSSKSTQNTTRLILTKEAPAWYNYIRDFVGKKSQAWLKKKKYLYEMKALPGAYFVDVTAKIYYASRFV